MSPSINAGVHHATTHPRPKRPPGLRPRPRLHGPELRLRPGHRRARRHRPDPRRPRTRRHLLRYRRSLWRHQRADRRGSAGAGARPGRHRHQVRLPRRRGRRGPRQQPAAHPRRGRSLAEKPAHRAHRPVLPAPGRSERADRGRGRRCGRPDTRRESRPFRPVRGRRRFDPPRPRRTAGSGAAKRVFAVVARAGARDPAAAGRTRHRLRVLQPAWQGFPDRRHRREHHVRQQRLPQQGAALRGRGAQGECARGGRGEVAGGREGRDAGADRTGLAAGAQTVSARCKWKGRAIRPSCKSSSAAKYRYTR